MAATIANAVDERDLGVAGAAQQMMTQVGVVAGIQIMQTVQAVAGRRRRSSARTTRPTCVGAAVAALGVVDRRSFVPPHRGAASTPAGRERGAPQGAPHECSNPRDAVR